MTREEAIEMLKKDKEQRGNCFISDALDMAIKALEQEPTKKICSKTCGTCRYFKKHRNKRNIEICKELYGENTICGNCTYWEDYCEEALPNTEYDYCSHYREVKE